MPTYDLECNKCKLEFEAFSKMDDNAKIKCPKCKGKSTVVLKNCDKKDWFKPHMTEHFTDTPIFVESKRHFKKLCLEHNVTSRALGDVRNYHDLNP